MTPAPSTTKVYPSLIAIGKGRVAMETEISDSEESVVYKNAAKRGGGNAEEA
ncbi:hypothetical protein QG37_07572 [Candidozyma auris]|uniref:Uncharacterized protein n=1 Tax=Candidozyma auris TaxID=498019 RepID=A0A0L0NPV7_CANAR|nr:hypothetical protein QG37_07572 [[Candida] auris]